MNLEQKIALYEEQIVKLSQEVQILKEKIAKMDELNCELLTSVLEQSKKLRYYEDMNKARRI